MAQLDLTTAQLHRLMPFSAHLGIELLSARPEEVVGTLAWSPSLTTAGGAMHGGALMTLADTVGAACAYLNLPDGAQTSTTSSSTVFVRGLRDGLVTATARPLHVGRSTIAVQTSLTDRDGRLAAQTTQSQAVLTPGGV